MATERIKELPLIVIVGPTASGKTNLAIELAKKYSGEIICADSRTIYRGMDIGTAKPDITERAEVAHWGLDLVDPGERFTAADFKVYANQKIVQIRDRNRIPFLVGGTGLYIEGVVFDFQFNGDINTTLRKKLEKMNLMELHKYCSENNVILPENSKNKRYIISAIERKGISAKRKDTPIENTIIVGITTRKDILRNRIEERAEQFFANEVVNEAKRLGEKYGWKNEAMTGNIYPIMRQLLQGKLTETQAKEKFTTIDWRLAKRQLTWLKRNQYIQWYSLKEAREYLQSVLTML